MAGFFGLSLGGSKGSSSTSRSGEASSSETQRLNQRESTNKITNQVQRQRSNASQTASQRQQKRTDLSFLDQQTQQGLQELFASVAGNPAQTEQLRQTILKRANAAPEDVAKLIDPIVAKATRQGNEKVGQAGQRLAQGAGSSMNTLVQQFTLDEQAKMQENLAALEAQLQFGARSQVNQEMQGVLSSQTNEAVQIANILKGATQTGTESTAGTSEQNSLTQLLNNLSTSELQNVMSSLVAVKDSSKQFEERGSGSTKKFGGGFNFGL